MTPLQPQRSGIDAGAAGILGLAILALLLAAGLAGGVLVSTVHPRPVAAPQIHASALLTARCPGDLAASSVGDEPRTCRRIEIANSGQARGSVTCVLANDEKGATARFADNQTLHHAVTVEAGQTSELLVTVDGTPSKDEAVAATCGITPAASA